MKAGDVSTFRKNINLQSEGMAVYPQPHFLEDMGKGYRYLDYSIETYL